MKNVVFALVVGLALGATVGHFLASTSGGTVAPSGRGPSAEAPRPASVPNTAPGPDSAPAPITPITTTPIAEGAAAVLFKMLPKIDARSGNGVIRGAVRTPDGVPVGGVVITAVPAEGPPGLPGPESEESAEVYVSRVATARLWRDRSTRRSESSPDGSYEIGGLGGGTYVLTARASDRDVDVRSDSDPMAAGTVVDFTAISLVELPILVRYADGRRPEAATVTVIRGSAGSEEAQVFRWTPAEPEIRVRCGSRRFFASIGRPETASAPSVDVEVVPGYAQPIELVLVPMGSVTGRVVVPEDEDVSAVTVTLVKGVAPAAVDDDFLREQPNRSYLDRGGWSFDFARLELGRYTVLAGRSDGNGGIGRTEVTVVEGTVAVQVALPPRDRTAAMEVVVSDANGTPLSGVTFTATYRHRDSTSMRGLEVLRSRDGRYLVLPEIPAELAARKPGPGEIETELTASHADHGSKVVSFRLGVDRELRIAFPPVASLVVTVPGLTASPVARKLAVVLVPRGAEERRWESINEGWLSGEEFHFGKFSAGPYDLSVFCEVDHKRVGVHQQVVELPAGTTTLSVPLPRVHDLRIRVPEGEVGATVTLTRKTGSPDGPRPSWNRDLDTGGRADFPLLPEGSYELRYRRSLMDVVVPTAAEVVFAAVHHNALRIRIQEREGYLAKAGFEDGDLVIGIEGTSVGRIEELRRRLQAAFLVGAPDTAFLVQRGERRLTITLKVAASPDDTPGGDVTSTRR